MAAHEKTIEHLLQMSSLTERGSRPEAITRSLQAVILLLDAEAAVLVLASPRRRGERLALYSGSDTPASLPLTLQGSAALAAFAEKHHALATPDLSEDAALVAGDSCPGVDAGPVMFVPIDQHDASPAYLAAYRRRGRARFSAIETEVMLLLAGWLGATLENIRLSAGTERLAITDDAIEVYNARYVKSALKREVRRANRFAQELSLLRIELDDATGEGVGAKTRKDVAALLASQVRSFDVLGRLGDGFLVVLPQTGRDAALEVAERMRASIEAGTFAPEAAGRVTATIAVANFPQDGNEIEALLAVAERALEQGRLRGGNCVSHGARRVA